MNTTNREREPTIKAVSRSYDIVESLIELGGASAVELSEHLDIPHSTTFDHLETLQQLEYVIKDDGSYFVSSKYLMLGNEMRYRYDIYRAARSELNRLSRETGEHAILLLEESGYGVYFYIAESEASLRVIVKEGDRVLLHANAPGKVLLAHMDEEEVEWILDHHGLPAITDNTITDRDELLARLADIRSDGYGLDLEEGTEGLYGVATPVLDRRDNDTLGAIALYSAADQDISHYLNDVLNPLQKTANTIELDIAYE